MIAIVFPKAMFQMDFNTLVTVMVSTKCGLNYKKWLRILGKV